jgi:hypothetical protein
VSGGGPLQSVAAVGLRWLSVEIEGVIAEPIDVFREIWADRGNDIFGEIFPSLFEGLDEPSPGAQVMEDRKIRQLATRWLYLMAFRCSSRLFSAMTPSSPHIK